MRILMFLGGQIQKVDPQRMTCGGSETCMLQLSQLLGKNHDVIVLGDIENTINDDKQHYQTIDFHTASTQMKGVVFDLVIANNYIDYMEILWEMNISFYSSIFWLHNLEPFITKEDSYKWFSHKHMNAVVCVSEWQANIVRQSFPDCAAKVVVIENGIDKTLFTPTIPSDRRGWNFIWSSEPCRGLYTILDWWPDILKVIPTAQLWITHPSYSRLDSSYNVYQPGIKLFGNVDKHELYELMHQCKYWLYPSDYPETFCLTALEVVSCGVIAICSDTGNLATMMNGSSYMFNSSWSDQEKKQHVLQLLNYIQQQSKEELQKYRIECKNNISHYSWNTVVRKWNMLIDPPNIELLSKYTYVITLDNQRKPEYDLELSKANIQTPKYQIHPAVDGRLVDTQYLEMNDIELYPWAIKSDNDWWNRDMFPGEIGCAISHFQVWNDIVNKNLPYALILEDDFKSTNISLTQDLLNLFPINWDMVYLGRNPLRHEPNNKYNDINEYTTIHNSIVIPDASYNMHAYMLSNSGARKLLQQNFNHMLMPVDEFIQCTYCKHDRVDLHYIWNDSYVYAVKHDIFQQSSTRESSQTLTLHTDYSVYKPEVINYDITTTEVNIFDYFTKPEQWVKKYLQPGVVDMDMQLLIDEPISNVFSFRLFTPQFCNEIIQHAEQQGTWTTDRHYFYPTTDMLLSQINFNTIYDDIIFKYVEPVIKNCYQLDGGCWDKMNNENFIAKYTSSTQSQLKIHHDASDISALVNLSDVNDYEGGGTYFPKYNAVHRPPQGTVSIHPGNITHKHGARPIYNGQRYIIVSFMSRHHDN